MATLTDRLLKQARDVDQPPAAFAEARAVLAEAIQVLTKLIDNHSLKVACEVGHSVNYGVQHNVVVKESDGDFRDIICRAYIPIDGYPVTFDFMEEDLATCGNKKEMEDALVSFFGNTDLKNRIFAYRRQSPMWGDERLALPEE
jgi:hypothetical protein